MTENNSSLTPPTPVTPDILNKKQKRILVIDATMLNTFQSCPWKYYIQFVKNLKPNAAQFHLIKGDLGHNILERYYVCIEKGIEKEESANLAIEYAREYYPTLDIDATYAEWIIQSFMLYHRRWLNDGIKVLEIEKPFMIQIYEDEELIILYSGKIDLYAEFPLIGAIPIDHKLRERKNEEIILNNQFCGYAIAKEKSVVYVNEFGLQETLEPEEKFRRQPLSYTDDLKKHWLRNTIQWCKRLDWHHQENNWPEIWNPFTCKNCSIKSVCESGRMEDKIRKLNTEFYTGEIWDVTKVLEGE